MTPFALLLLGALLAIRGVQAYATNVRLYQIPLPLTLFARSTAYQHAHPDPIKQAWRQWQTAIEGELLRFGDARAVDLRTVPQLFRRYALQQYYHQFGKQQAVKFESDQLSLIVFEQVQRWQRVWSVVSEQLAGTRRETLYTPLDRLNSELTQLLKLTPQPPHNFPTCRVYPVTASALRIRIPTEFPIIYLTEQQFTSATLDSLVDAIRTVQEDNFFAIIVPLQAENAARDTTSDLRELVQQSGYAHDFIILSNADILDLFMSRQPRAILTDKLLRQVDLSTLSPFYTSGPVPENMFFGREGELRTLTEQIAHSNFAIVGNRKIGKTSLLQRSQRRLEQQAQFQTLYIDCQSIDRPATFLSAFQKAAEWQTPLNTVEQFADAIKGMQPAGNCILVLFLDEVDALLAYEQQHGELLVATWRKLAQAHLCHFIFCGSTGLARQLENPRSVFFNFPQPMAMRYMNREVSELILVQPLETIGIEIEDRAAFIAQAYALTSGHPNMLQQIGYRLVMRVNERTDRLLYLSDMQALATDVTLMADFLRTIWGEAGSLEKMITLLADHEPFSFAEIHTALAANEMLVDIEELDAAFKMLEIYAIIKRDKKGYHFVPRAFRQMLTETQDADRLLFVEKRKFLKEKYPK